MNAQTRTIAENCLKASYGGTMSFPEIVGTLIGAGFEGYVVDYRRNTQTCYLPDGDSVALDELGRALVEFGPQPQVKSGDPPAVKEAAR